MATATVTSKGQVTIPKEVRDLLDLRSGDRLSFVVRSSGEIVLKAAKTKIRDLAGLLHRKGQRVVSIEEMDAGMARSMGRRR
jgi:antitoxin PrlF